ncbi:MAG: response regulator transcription factor [Actinobacteria bacterium]|nr:response regulator transcription factor [Actinomycetota bacterium]
MIKILVVDDQALIRTGFRMILEAEEDFTVVGEAADGEESLTLAERLSPDVILMDVRMPNMDGVEATKRLVESFDSKVLILTTFALDEYVFSAVRAGASGFMLKDAPPDDLVSAVRIVARGDGLIEPRMTRRLMEEFARQPTKDGRTPASDLLPDLTPREIDVLQLVGQGHSNSEIAQTLFISETTVKTHVTHILTKLGMRDRVQAVVFAFESGLLSAGGNE